MTQIPSPARALRDRLQAALSAIASEQDPALHRSVHADFQADVALALARTLGKKPRDIATTIVAGLPADDVIAEATVSGPGFINLTLRGEYLARAAASLLTDDRLGAPPAARAERVVVDYSSPNVAKEMHVGHIRSTIIGDAIARQLEFLGHTVLRQNHVGDWGTPFGMLIEHLLDVSHTEAEGGVRELGRFYREARAKFDADPVFAERSRLRVVRLQGADPATLALWRRLVDASSEHFGAVYDRLGVTLRPEHVAGESTYNDELADVVAELERAGLAVESDGAMCVFPPGFTGREGTPTPLIVRKQDGGFGYATTDLAALRARLGRLQAERIIYVVGAPQAQHFAMLFATARLAGWVREGVRLEHAAFGSVLGTDRKMLKTRAGEAVTLMALLDEARERARAAVDQKAPDMDPAVRESIAGAVGMGAIKYADLSNDRIKDYVFDWDRMLAFEGNTAPYLMYAHARICSILRRAVEMEGEVEITVEAPQERRLALELLQFGAIVDRAAETLQPHRLCGQLYEVATAFTGFYEACPVLKAEGALRASRLALCRLTARVLARGLDLLGISAPDQM
jgi:arginyl-tRNA synthetase